MMSDEKLVPKLRFSGFDDNWEIKKLDDLSKIQRGASPRPISSKKWYDFENKNVGWVRIGDVTASSKYLTETEDYFSEEGIKKSRFLPKGSLIMSICATIGKPIITDIDTCIHDGFVGFSELNINKEFLYYYLNILEPKFYSLSQTGSQANLNSDLVRISKIGVPSLKEQEKIVNFLSIVDNKIDLLQSKLQAYQDFKKYLMQQIFAQKLRFAEFDDEWKPYKIGDISKTYSGGTPSTSIKEYYEGDIPFIKSGEINNDITEQYITEDAINNSSAKRVQKGDLLLALYGATSGEVAISKINGAINQAVLKIENDMDNYFQYCYFLMYKDQIVYKYLQGGQGNLSANIIKKLEFKYPSLTEQKKISQFFMSFDNKLELYENKIIKYNNLKKGLLQQMFGYVHIILNFCVKICFIR